ncbi:hypothetical protein AK812_SmicGene41586 [Symbiodinium microadriaticum]|uniref:C3H1-type domain-containing protein n=1 Tax=Symbiodinium microadriaticum TaxID=2951 RepID=A0A1Q9C5Q7_SYMMI|nr:hypothetical protein AK812_SmicGene41586 [Symbiodinium microadriaticum]
MNGCFPGRKAVSCAKESSFKLSKAQEAAKPLCYRRTFIDIEAEPCMKLLRCNSVPPARRAGEDDDVQVSKDLASVYKRMEVSGSEIQNSEEATAEEGALRILLSYWSSAVSPQPSVIPCKKWRPLDADLRMGQFPARLYVSSSMEILDRVFFQVGQCENGDSCGYCHLRHEKRPRLPDRRSTAGAPRAAKLVGDDAEYLKGLLLRMSFGASDGISIHRQLDGYAASQHAAGWLGMVDWGGFLFGLLGIVPYCSLAGFAEVECLVARSSGVFVDAARHEMEKMRRTVQVNA